MFISQSSVDNRLLAILSPADFKIIAPHLEWVDFKIRQNLYQPGQRAEYAYFPVSGICSVIALAGDNVKSETGIIGREGFVGTKIVLYAESSPSEIVVQMPGRALQISRENLQKVMASNQGILTLLLRFVHVFSVQISQTPWQTVTIPLANGSPVGF